MYVKKEYLPRRTRSLPPPRFQKSINVFRVMEGTIPSGVESRLIDFLSCLSAQQAFVLRVMSVIGIAGIESDLLEVQSFIVFQARASYGTVKAHA